MSDIKYYMSELGTNNRHVAYRYSVLVEQCEQLRQQIAERDKRIESLEGMGLCAWYLWQRCEKVAKLLAQGTERERKRAVEILDYGLKKYRDAYKLAAKGKEAEPKSAEEIDITEGTFIRVEGELHRVVDISETSALGAYRILTEKVD